MKRNALLNYGLTVLTASAALLGAGGTSKAADAKKPNILVIWGDDIGQFNLSCYNMGMMGYKTPNIDRIAHEGAVFTDWYGQQSCTAGRAASSPASRPSAPASPRSVCRARRKVCSRKIRRLPTCLSRSATLAASSARIIWATATSFCPRSTASMNSSATSTT